MLNVSDEAEVERYISTFNDSQKTHDYLKGVVFYDIVNDVVPEKLRYAIRDTYRWNTRELYTPLQAGPSENGKLLFGLLMLKILKT